MRHFVVLVKRKVIQIQQNNAKTLDYLPEKWYKSSIKKGVLILNSVELMTVFDRLNGQIRDNNLLYCHGDEIGRISMIEIRGKITFAYELGLITTDQWENLISKAFLTIDGG